MTPRPRIRRPRPQARPPGFASRLAAIGFIFAVLAVIAELLAGFGARSDWWPYRDGITGLRWAAFAGLGGGILALLGCFFTHGSRSRLLMGVLGFAIGAAAFGIPYSMYQSGQKGPRLNDITTDTDNPPAFVSALPIRKNASNPPEYPGAEFAALQQKAYPHIAPIIKKTPISGAFDQALSVARSMGWEIIATVPAEGRIEAVATSMLFGFKDDVVIRVKEADGGARVDIRSKSRVGRNDYGANAKRIVAFTLKLRSAG